MAKCGGLSFKNTLVDIFGKDLQLDYMKKLFRIPARPRNLHAQSVSLIRTVVGLPRAKCVYGHFLPLKYLRTTASARLKFPDTFYMTFVREPVDRACSHYHYWKRNPDRKSKLCRQMINENWSFEKFVLHPFQKNMYHQYLYGFPAEYFDFIGITEDYEYSIECLSRLRPEFSNAVMYKTNASEHDAGHVWEIDSALRKDAEQYHAKDVALYHHALSRLPKRGSL
jgi:hypothetical protein